MPTPIDHLVMAQELVAGQRLLPGARRLLEQERGAFMFGHTAPDVQTINHRPRDETHFYLIPPCSDDRPERLLLTRYPELAAVERLSAAHAAFVAGYMGHLLADILWWQQVFAPVFVVAWQTREESVWMHNVLRTWIDLQSQRRLGGHEAALLAALEIGDWLPFVPRQDLEAWRDLLVGQLEPGQVIRTAEVFAARMHVRPAVLENAVHSDRLMESLMAQVSSARLERYGQDVFEQSVELVNRYLERRL